MSDTAQSQQSSESKPEHNVASMMVDLLEQVHADPAFIRLSPTGGVENVITFKRFDQLVGAAAGGLAERGIGPGSKVVVFIPMSLDLYITLLAIFRLGAVATFIEPWGGRKMVEQAAKLVEPDAFIGTPKSFLLRIMSSSLRRVPIAISTGRRRMPGAERFTDLLRTPADRAIRDAAPRRLDDPALVTFTTGSTGTPKGSNRTHEILLAQHHALAAQVPHVDNARVITNLPVVVLHNLGRGAATILPPDKINQDPAPDPRAYHDMLARSTATMLAVSPGPLRQLTLAPGRVPIAGITNIYTGGGPVSPALIEALQPVVPKAEIVTLYGSTEAEPIAHASAEQVLERRDEMQRGGGIYVGHPVDEVDLLIIRVRHKPIVIDESTALEDWSVAEGSPGEVIVAGDHVNRTYWNNRQAEIENKIVDENGRIWHRTGDIAQRDKSGGIWLLGRRGAGWNIKGNRVWSLQIETPITDRPEVAQAAICQPTFSGADREFKNATAVLAVEPAIGFSRQDARTAALAVLTARRYDSAIEVRSLAKIPVDKRHATKIDVAALQSKLKPQNNDDY